MNLTDCEKDILSYLKKALGVSSGLANYNISIEDVVKNIKMWNLSTISDATKTLAAKELVVVQEVAPAISRAHGTPMRYVYYGLTAKGDSVHFDFSSE